MVKQQGVDVYLAPFGREDQRYPEHSPPAGSSHANVNNKEVYIEAVDGERFVLVVDLTKDFDSKGSPMLRIQYGIDSKHEFTGQWNMTGIYTYEKLRKNASNVANLKGRTVVSSEYKKIGEQ